MASRNLLQLADTLSPNLITEEPKCGDIVASAVRSGMDIFQSSSSLESLFPFHHLVLSQSDSQFLIIISDFYLLLQPLLCVLVSAASFGFFSSTWVYSYRQHQRLLSSHMHLQTQSYNVLQLLSNFPKVMLL